MFVEPFLPFCLFILALYATPGPATLSIAASGGTFGFKKTIPYIFGLLTGMTIIFLMVALGLGVLFTTYPTAHKIFKWISILYMFYLAYKIARASPISSATGKRLGFFHGVFLNLLNPKAYFAVIATVAQFTNQGSDYVRSFIILAMWALSFAFTIAIVWSYLGAFISKRLSSTRISSKINLVFAVLLVGSVLVLFFL